MTTRIKYPRTPHLPWSQGVTSDDIRCVDTTVFEGQRVVVTEKMDGENTTLHRDYCHARSLDSAHHSSRDWIKRFHGRLSYQIPAGWRICGENLFAQHSIIYTELKSYFYGFSIWDESNCCLDWDDTQLWFDLLGIVSPAVLYRGEWNLDVIKALAFDSEKVEGYVVRLETGFVYGDFAKAVAKCVRKGHVQTDQHWMHQAVVPNGLISPEEDM
nr:RNA ligase family protein [Thaumasiovibrio subtropicus]